MPLSTSVPLPVAMARAVAVKPGPSMSAALASSCAWVIKRTPESSAIAARVTVPLVGASLTATRFSVMVFGTLSKAAPWSRTLKLKPA